MESYSELEREIEKLKRNIKYNERYVGLFKDACELNGKWYYKGVNKKNNEILVGEWIEFDINVINEPTKSIIIDQANKRKKLKKVLQMMNDYDFNSGKSLNERPPDNQDKSISNNSNELMNAHGIILRLRNKNKTLEKGINKEELERIIHVNKCYKKNGKLNYSAIAEILGISNHTAKKWCDSYSIK